MREILYFRPVGANRSAWFGGDESSHIPTIRSSAASRRSGFSGILERDLSCRGVAASCGGPDIGKLRSSDCVLFRVELSVTTKKNRGARIWPNL